MQITINLTDVEYKAMQTVAISPEEWIENLVLTRIQIASENIIQTFVKYALERNIEIPNNKDALILKAFELGVVAVNKDVEIIIPVTQV